MMAAKPRTSPYRERLLRPVQMTIAAGFKCKDGAVICADSQETIPDYVKMYGAKITTFVHLDKFRVALTGAGGADMLEMIFQQIQRQLTGSGYTVEIIRDIVSETVYNVYMKHVLPFPKEERPWFQILAAIQVNGQPTLLLQSQDTFVRRIDHYCYLGSVAFAHFVGSQLDTRSLPVYVVRSLALYILQLVKEYDPNCGKNTDIVCLYDEDWAAEYPSPFYIDAIETHLSTIYQLHRNIIASGLAYLDGPSAAREHSEHLQEHIDKFRQFHTEHADERGRLRQEFLIRHKMLYLKRHQRPQLEPTKAKLLKTKRAKAAG